MSSRFDSVDECLRACTMHHDPCKPSLSDPAFVVAMSSGAAFVDSAVTYTSSSRCCCLARYSFCYPVLLHVVVQPSMYS